MLNHEDTAAKHTHFTSIIKHMFWFLQQVECIYYILDFIPMEEGIWNMDDPSPSHPVCLCLTAVFSYF